MCSKVVLTDKITLYMMKNKNIKYYIFVWSKDKKKKLTDRKEQKMELVNGRPKIEDGRFDKEIRVYDFLDKIGVDYQRVDHVAAMKMEECEEVDKTLGDGTAICKNLFLCNRQKTDFYLLLIPGDKVFKTKDLSAQIGSARLSFGTADYMEEFLDVTPGSVSILALMNDTEHLVRLLVDSDVLREEYFGCHPCINTSSLRLKTEDVFETFLKAVDHTMTEVHL